LVTISGFCISSIAKTIEKQKPNPKLHSRLPNFGTFKNAILIIGHFLEEASFALKEDSFGIASSKFSVLIIVAVLSYELVLS